VSHNAEVTRRYFAELTRTPPGTPGYRYLSCKPYSTTQTKTYPKRPGILLGERGVVGGE